MLRRRATCPATTLRRELLANKGVDLEESTIRKILRGHGCKWLPRAQKRKYGAARKNERLKFAKAVLRLTKAKLREKLPMAMDGVSFFLAGTLSVPDTRRVGRAIVGRAVGRWLRTCHASPRIQAHLLAEWCREVRRGKLAKAVQSISPKRRAGLWTVLCDNEAFLHLAASQQVMTAAGVRAWRVPASSPDNNPVEKMWAWLQRRIRAKDCDDLRRRRNPIGKMAFKARVRSMLPSKQAQRVAACIAAGFRTTCKEVVAKQGGMARG